MTITSTLRQTVTLGSSFGSYFIYTSSGSTIITSDIQISFSSLLLSTIASNTSYTPSSTMTTSNFFRATTAAINSISTSSVASTSSAKYISPPSIDDVSLNNESSASKTIGLSVGLPVGLVSFCLLVVMLCFYFKKSFTISDGISSSGKGHSRWKSLIGIKDKKLGNSQYRKPNPNMPFRGNMARRAQNNIPNMAKYHVLTPSKPFHSSMKHQHSIHGNENLDAEKYLYSNPPNIVRISSTIPFFEGDLEKNLEDSDKADAENGLRDELWKYDSPLSKWFLRSSTYLRSSGWKSPAIQLKQLKTLSKVNKSYVSDKHFYDEKSPILKNYGAQSPTSQTDMDNNKNALTPTQLQNTYESILQQTLELAQNDYEPNNLIQLDNVPNPKMSKMKSYKNSKKRREKLKRHLDQIAKMKPLPSRPVSKYVEGEICRVIKGFTAKLADEICLIPGEYVKILATHTDGWCLVEKCGKLGTPRVSVDNFMGSANKEYINEDRGIVPGQCLA